MKSRFIGLLAALAALLVLHACEFGYAPGGGGTGGEGLAGILVDSKGAGVAGARVRVYPAEVAPAKGAASQAAMADSATTQADGRFRFAKLPAGRYNLEASIRRHDTTYAVFIGGIEYTGGRLDLGRDTLQAAGSLRIELRTVESAIAGLKCLLVGTTRTAVSDDSGTCVFSELAPGVYQVSATFEGRKFTRGNLVVLPAVSAREALSLIPQDAPVPADWTVARTPDYAFYIPPEMALQAEGYGLDSWNALYRSPTVTLSISAGLVGLPPRPDTLPGYFEDTLLLSAEVRAIYSAYRDPSAGLVLWLRAEKETGSSTSLTVFKASGGAEADSARAAKMLRSVRPWLGEAVPAGPVGPTPVLKSPAANATGLSLSPTLTWGDVRVDGPAQIFRLQISRDALFSDYVLNDSIYGPKFNGNYYETAGPLQPSTQYFWRVIEIYNGTTATSGTRAFTTVAASGPAPGIPALVSPAPEEVVFSNQDSVTFAWFNGSTATNYHHLQVALDESFVNPVRNDSLAMDVTAVGTRYHRTALKRGQNYYWRMIAVGPGGFTSSEIRRMTLTNFPPD